MIDPYVKIDTGFCSNKAAKFINLIPEVEISEDITNMYNYLVATNE